MPEFGSFCLLVGLMLAAYTFVAGTMALWWSGRVAKTADARAIALSGRLLETSRRAGIASFVVVTCAAIALVWAAFTNDYSVSYILHHTNRELPTAYKFSALWSGQEGSLLLWSWLLACYGFVLRVRNKVDVRLSAFASTILASTQVFFLLLLNFAAPPFAIEPGPRSFDGFGLNPLLQYPEMVIHPPMLYLGYVGFAVPFAFALGALMMRYPGEKWIHITRRWTMVTWLFLTCGIFLGAHWAYSVLGWGGYWGWDPVENASLMPWLTGTAFLHSVMMQEKRGMMKSWNVWLIFSTFLLTLLGTLLTRAGLVSSVHAFAESNIGWWFVIYMVMVLAVCLFTFVKQRDHLKSENHFEGVVSREASFLFNNMILLVACLTVLIGTLFPVLSEYVQGTKTSMNSAYYNVVEIPIGLFLLFLTGIGPLLAWRSTTLRSMRRNFVLPGASVLGTAVVLLTVSSVVPTIMDFRPWKAEDGWASVLFSLIAISLGVGVVTAISSEFLRGANVVHVQTGQNLVAAMGTLMRRNTRRYGGYLVHFGIVVMFIGIAGGAFNQSHEQTMGYGDEMSIGPYRLVCLSYTQDSNANYDTDFALLDVYKNGTKQFQLAPEKRFYHASQTPSTMVALHSTALADLYVIFEGRDPETNRPIIKTFLNPLIAWIWIGVLIVVAGTLFALVPSATARRREVAAKAAAEIPVIAEVQRV
jgi:cytochrome c-type biogenesis protein CcmF